MQEKKLYPKDDAILSNFKICYKNHDYKKSDTVSLLSCYTVKLNNKRYTFIYKNCYFMNLSAKSLKIDFFVCLFYFF